MIIYLLITVMGNSGSHKSQFQEHNWRKIGENNNRVILYNDITMKSVQRHEAVLDCDEGEAISLCKWRAGLPQDCGVVDLFEYGIKKVGMCNSQSDLYVVTQRIHLLQEIGSLSKPEAFLILRDVANGLRILFGNFGHFNPRPNIIGINAEGRARVWTNQNFAKLQPEADKIPIQRSQLGIVNNFIHILQSKTYRDHSLPIDYPRNLDLVSVVNYINKVFADLKGFQVDRVYIDRAEFNKKYNELRQRQQKQQLSRMIASEAQRRYQEIQNLHENLRMQQAELARRQQELRIQAQQQEQRLRQEQMKRKIQMQRQQQMLAAQQNQLAMVQMQNRRSNQNLATVDMNPNNMLKGTASTNRSDVYAPQNQQIAMKNGQQVITRHNSMQRIPPPQQQQQQTIQNYPPPRPQQQQQPNSRPPLPPGPRGQAQVKPVSQPGKQDNIRREIQMVDSMILMQEDDSIDQNKRYIQSRILTYKS